MLMIRYLISIRRKVSDYFQYCRRRHEAMTSEVLMLKWVEKKRQRKHILLV